MNLKTTLTAVAAALGIFGAMNSTQAAPVTYNFASGQATLSLIYGASNLLQPGSTIALTGTQVTFDAAIPQLTSFQFQRVPAANVLGAGLLLGTTLTISNFNVVPGTGYGDIVPTVGSNPYFYSVGPLDVTGIYSLTGAINQLPTPLAQVNPSLTGQINTSGGTLGLNGITLGLFAIPPILGGGFATLKADVLFTGVVPVPAAALLFASALAGLPLIRRRKVA